MAEPLKLVLHKIPNTTMVFELSLSRRFRLRKWIAIRLVTLAALVLGCEAEVRTVTTREKLAEYAHEAWAGWMRYLFAKGILNADRAFTIPALAVERWVRQMDMPYSDLPESEKESDRAEADKIISIVRGGEVPPADVIQRKMEKEG